MNTLIKAVLAASVATSGASYLTPTASDPKIVEACRGALVRTPSAGTEGIRMLEIAASPARPNNYRGIAELREGEAVWTRVNFTCRVDGHRATITLFPGLV